VKKIILALVFLGAAFCLYAQESGETWDGGAYDGGLPVGDGGAAYDDSGSYDGGSYDDVLVGDDSGAYDSSSYDDGLMIGDGGESGETETKERRGFFGGLLGYLDNSEVETLHLDRKRIVDLRLAHANLEFGNNLVGMGDIFKKQIVIDLDQMSSRIGDKGAAFGFGFGVTPLRINVSPTPRWGGGAGTSTAGRFDLSIPKEFLDLIAEGNDGERANTSGEFAISGSLFYEIGLNVHGTLPFFGGKLSFGVDPAFYSPLLYIPRSNINYTLETRDRIRVAVGGNYRVYTPIYTKSVDIGDVFGSGGVDVSLSAEYALFTRLDLGLSISHIPMLPARMSKGYELSIPHTDIIDVTDLNEIDPDNLIKDIEIKGDDDYVSLPALTIFRPMRFDFYNIYRPFKSDIFSVRPNIGFTVLTASEETYLNMGTRITMDLKRLFVLYFDSGLEEGLWRHKLGFELNLRAFELDLEAGMHSQDYLRSWAATGLSVKLGLAFGW
jgi:hypothetical protein